MSKYIISIFDNNDKLKWSKEYTSDQFGAMVMCETIMKGFRENPDGYDFNGITIVSSDKLKVDFEE